MSFVQNFSVSQIIGFPNKIVITDVSTGSDSAITSRRVYLQTSNASIYLVQEGTTTNYEVWNISNPTITLDVLDKDYCLNAIVQWLNSSNQVLYTKNAISLFMLYNRSFLYTLTQLQTANPFLINESPFYPNKGKMITDLDSARNVIELANDQVNAQICLDRATQLRLEQQYRF